jgi:predicted ATPase/DNA-binding CsgD family transcriptional regulator
MATHNSPLPPLARESLTPRERDILALLAQDLSDSEIADRLVITVNTVKWYNRQIFAKLGVKTRRQAADYTHVHSVLVDQRAWQALPEQTTPFIGRRDELEQLTDLLKQGPSRLVTVLAPGGMGKTRLALVAAEACESQFSDGVCFMQLGALASVDQLLPAIADATGFQLTSDRRTPRQQVFNFLADKELLLLLDNFEHLVEGATLLADLLEASSHVRLLVISRERLNLSCETLFTLGGMACPESPRAENGLEYGAVQLFIECGRRLAPSKTSEDATSIIEICQLTQGMPLAIELAGTWLIALSPAEIAAEIAQGLDFLQTTMRDIPPRQRSVRVVCESAWQRLNREEQNVFRRLSMFRGGCTREAAQAVCAAQTDSLLSLANKALISRNPNRHRYDVHELLRQFAEEQLRRAGEFEATRRRHADFFLAFLSARLPALQNGYQPAVLDEIEADFDNIREALHYALAHDLTADFIPATECLRLFFEARVHLSSAVHHPGLPYTSFRLFFEARAHFSADAAAFFSKALAKAPTPALAVTLREGLGDALQVSAAYDQARQEFEQAYLLLPSDSVVLRYRLLRKAALTVDAQNRLEDALLILADAEATLTRAGQRDQAW